MNLTVTCSAVTYHAWTGETKGLKENLIDVPGVIFWNPVGSVESGFLHPAVLRATSCTEALPSVAPIVLWHRWFRRKNTKHIRNLWTSCFSSALQFLWCNQCSVDIKKISKMTKRPSNFILTCTVSPLWRDKSSNCNREGWRASWEQRKKKRKCNFDAALMMSWIQTWRLVYQLFCRAKEITPKLLSQHHSCLWWCTGKLKTMICCVFFCHLIHIFAGCY